MNKTLQQLEKWEDVAWKNEDQLLKVFAKGANVMLFGGVWFCSERFKIYYILDCGQHVTDDFPIKEWLKFYRKHK